MNGEIEVLVHKLKQSEAQLACVLSGGRSPSFLLLFLRGLRE